MIAIILLEAAVIITLAILWWRRRIHVRDCHRIIRNLTAKLAKVHTQRMDALDKARLAKLSQTAGSKAKVAEVTAMLRQEFGLRLVISND